MLYYSRAAGDAVSAVNYFEESVNFLLKVPKDDLEVTVTDATHTCIICAYVCISIYFVN